MKRIKFLSYALALALLCGCAGELPDNGISVVTTTPTGIEDGPPWFMTCRIVDGAEDGNLFLAENGGGPGAVYRLNVSGLELAEPLKNGALINVFFDSILETYPGQFSGVSVIEPTQTEPDDRCGLYLQVLEDLWAEEYRDSIMEVGVDLSDVADLSEAEKAAVAWHFGEKHGIVPIIGTCDELAEQGYLTAEIVSAETLPGDAPSEITVYYWNWDNGSLFRITGGAEEGFEARFWMGYEHIWSCTAAPDGTGGWSYQADSITFACG